MDLFFCLNHITNPTGLLFLTFLALSYDAGVGALHRTDRGPTSAAPRSILHDAPGLSGVGLVAFWSQIRRPAVLVSSAASLPYHYVITVEVLWWYAVVADLYVSSALIAPGLVLHGLTLKHCFNISV